MFVNKEMDVTCKMLLWFYTLGGTPRQLKCHIHLTFTKEGNGNVMV